MSDDSFFMLIPDGPLSGLRVGVRYLPPDAPRIPVEVMAAGADDVVLENLVELFREYLKAIQAGGSELAQTLMIADITGELPEAKR